MSTRSRAAVSQPQTRALFLFTCQGLLCHTYKPGSCSCSLVKAWLLFAAKTSTSQERFSLSKSYSDMRRLWARWVFMITSSSRLKAMCDRLPLILTDCRAMPWLCPPCQPFLQQPHLSAWCLLASWPVACELCLCVIVSMLCLTSQQASSTCCLRLHVLVCTSALLWCC